MSRRTDVEVVLAAMAAARDREYDRFLWDSAYRLLAAGVSLDRVADYLERCAPDE
jgi:hypothetical protein